MANPLLLVYCSDSGLREFEESCRSDFVSNPAAMLAAWQRGELLLDVFEPRTLSTFTYEARLLLNGCWAGSQCMPVCVVQDVHAVHKQAGDGIQPTRCSSKSAATNGQQSSRCSGKTALSWPIRGCIAIQGLSCSLLSPWGVLLQVDPPPYPELFTHLHHPTQQHQPGSSSVVASLATFQANFNHITGGIFEGVDWSNMMVAGGVRSTGPCPWHAAHAVRLCYCLMALDHSHNCQVPCGRLLPRYCCAC